MPIPYTRQEFDASAASGLSDTVSDAIAIVADKRERKAEKEHREQELQLRRDTLKAQEAANQSIAEYRKSQTDLEERRIKLQEAEGQREADAAAREEQQRRDNELYKGLFGDALDHKMGHDPIAFLESEEGLGDPRLVTPKIRTAMRDLSAEWQTRQIDSAKTQAEIAELQAKTRNYNAEALVDETEAKRDSEAHARLDTFQTALGQQVSLLRQGKIPQEAYNQFLLDSTIFIDPEEIQRFRTMGDPNVQIAHLAELELVNTALAQMLSTGSVATSADFLFHALTSKQNDATEIVKRHFGIPDEYLSSRLAFSDWATENLNHDELLAAAGKVGEMIAVGNAELLRRQNIALGADAGKGYEITDTVREEDGITIKTKTTKTTGSGTPAQEITAPEADHGLERFIPQSGTISGANAAEVGQTGGLSWWEWLTSDRPETLGGATTSP